MLHKTGLLNCSERICLDSRTKARSMDTLNILSLIILKHFVTVRNTLFNNFHFNKIMFFNSTFILINLINKKNICKCYSKQSYGSFYNILFLFNDQI